MKNVDELAQCLADECPLRIMGVLHARGLFRHVRHPHVAGGAVLCYSRERLGRAPEGSSPTGAQALLDRLLLGEGEREGVA